MDFQKLDKEGLSNLLVEKHKNFAKEYRKEYDIIERISVLREKQEQLDYWLRDTKDDPEKNQKYAQTKDVASREMDKLSQELRSLHEGRSRKTHGPPETDVKARHKWLRGQIDQHDEAANYWFQKKTEIEDEKKPKEAPATKQKPKESRLALMQKKMKPQKKKKRSTRARAKKKAPEKETKT